MRQARLKRMGTAAMLFVLLVFLAWPNEALAARQMILTSSASEVRVGETIEIKIDIDTDGQSIGAIGFSIDFSTEDLEGLLPNQAGSVFPMCATLTATKYECGKTGQEGFTGSGTVTTLNFKGRRVGEAVVTLQAIQAAYGPSTVGGFSANTVSINVTPAAEESAGTSSGTSTVSQTPGQAAQASQSAQTEQTAPAMPASTTQAVTPIKIDEVTVSAPAATPQVPEEPVAPSEIFGTPKQVSGATGSSQEEPLKPQTFAEATDAEVVKGVFAASPANIGFISTFLLLLLTGYLGLKLFFTEKRRHLELEHLFNIQLGALGALESKLDIVEQKGEGAKEKLLQELEVVKNQIRAEAEAKLNGKKVKESGAALPVSRSV